MRRSYSSLPESTTFPCRLPAEIFPSRGTDILYEFAVRHPTAIRQGMPTSLRLQTLSTPMETTEHAFAADLVFFDCGSESSIFNHRAQGVSQTPGSSKRSTVQPRVSLDSNRITLNNVYRGISSGTAKISKRYQTNVSKEYAPCSCKSLGEDACYHPCTSSLGNAAISLSKQDIEEMRVIGQVDKKFIIAKFRNILYAIDQHAADERINYENLQNLVASHFPKPAFVSSVALDVATEIGLEPQRAMILEDNISCIVSWGWEFRWTESREKKPKRSDQSKMPEPELTWMRVCRVPTVFGNIIPDVEEQLKQYLDCLEAQDRSLNEAVLKLVIPPYVMRSIASHACRHAIMFGDMLSFQQSEQLLRDLSKCDIPFQCAHGRPSIYPVWEFRNAL